MLLFFIKKTEAQTLNVRSTTYNSCTFGTYAQLMNPCSVSDYFYVSFGNFGNKTYPYWSLKVRAKTSFTNGSYSVDPRYAAIKFNRVSSGTPSAGAIGVSSTPVNLATSDVTLINRSSAPLGNPNYYTEHTYDLLIQGGPHLLVPAGTYSATLTFSFYDQNNKLLDSKDVQAQFIVAFDNTCSGTTIRASQAVQSTLSTYNDLMNGTTAREAFVVQYDAWAANCSGWSLKVRALGNFINGSSQIDPKYVSLRFARVSAGEPSASAIGVSTTPVPLGLTEVALIDHSQGAFNKVNTSHTFDMIIQGGNQLLAAVNGTYSADLAFTLYNENNQIVSQTIVTGSFQVNSSSNYSYSVVLQNGGDLVSLAFNNTSDIVSGVSSVKAAGLKITGYKPYQVIIKTAGPDFTSPVSQATIPVSVVKLQVSAPGSLPAVICKTLSLSPSDQIFISNPLSDHTYQVVQYDLKYYTEARDARVISSGPGTYTTSVLFVVLPQ